MGALDAILSTSHCILTILFASVHAKEGTQGLALSHSRVILPVIRPTLRCFDRECFLTSAVAARLKVRQGEALVALSKSGVSINPGIQHRQPKLINEASTNLQPLTTHTAADG